MWRIVENRFGKTVARPSQSSPSTAHSISPISVTARLVQPTHVRRSEISYKYLWQCIPSNCDKFSSSRDVVLICVNYIKILAEVLAFCSRVCRICIMEFLAKVSLDVMPVRSQDDRREQQH